MDRNMKKWHSYKLSDVVRFNPSERLLKGEIAKKVPMDLLQPYTRGISGFEMASYTGGSKFRNGDTLMARITPCLENGKTAYVSMLDEDEVGFGSTEYIVFRNIEGITDNKFVYYFVTSPWFRDIAVKSMVGSSGRQRVQQAMLENLVVNLPPLAEQKQIAGILGALDDKIELNRCINDNLEQQAQALFKAWFVDNAVIDDASVSDYFIPLRGKNLLTSDAKGGEVPVVAGGLTPSAYHNVANTKAPVITISASGANAGYVKLWGVPVWSADSSYIDSSVTPHIYFWYNLLKFSQKNIFDSQTGSAQPHIYPKHIGDIHIPNLDLDKVADYNKIVTPIYEQITNTQKLNMQLTVTRDTLLPKLMSGEIKI